MVGPIGNDASEWKRLCREIGLDEGAACDLPICQVAYLSNPPIGYSKSGDLLDAPLSDVVDSQVIIGDPGEVVVTLHHDGTLEVAEFAVRWSSQEPIPVRLETGTVLLSMRDRVQTIDDALVEAMTEIHRRRRRRFRRCVNCREMTPPEWWHGERLCSGCATEVLGVVY